jgi:uncharacterized membrane protein YqjE
MGRSLAGLGHDVLTLAELQARLLAVDLSEGRTRAVRAAALLVGGLLLAIGTVPVLLLGLGWLLIRQFQWSEAAAFLTTSGLAACAACALAAFGWKRLQTSLAVLTRSRRELRENIEWLKQALALHAHKPPPGRSHGSN